MSLTEQEQKDVYGMTVEDMRSCLVDILSWQVGTVDTLAVSMMSDVQEQILLGDSEAARQTLNRCKWLLMRRDDFNHLR